MAAVGSLPAVVSGGVPMSCWSGGTGSIRDADVASPDCSRHHVAMDRSDQRQHSRGSVALAVVVSPGGEPQVSGVVDVSEGGACLEWTLREDVPVGTPVRLCFLLAGDQTLELDGCIVRRGNGLAGIQFSPEQQDIARQLMAETRSDD